MSCALILGASRGIGMEFVRQYVGAGWQVFGTFREEEARTKLRDAGAHTLRLDINDPNDVAGIAWQLEGEEIDAVIVNAGVYGPRMSAIAQPPADEDFDLVMRTNVLGAMRLVPVVTPLVIPGRGTLAFISSRMGSISEASASYGALYRVSKAAVNMVAKMAHAQYAESGARVLVLHPGWVRTDMGGPNADVEVSDSVSGMRNVIEQKSTYPSGSFLDYRGKSLAW